MLEACIDRRTGEIIVVKPRASLWSDKETNGPVLVVVRLDDPDLVVPGSSRAYPYAVYPDAQKMDGEMVRPPFTKMSRWKVDRRGLTPNKEFRISELKESLDEYPAREVLNP